MPAWRISFMQMAQVATAIFTDGHQQRDFVYVLDVVAGTTRAFESAPAASGLGRASRQLNEL